MVKRRKIASRRDHVLACVCFIAAFSAIPAPMARCQEIPGQQVHYKVTSTSQRLEMIVTTSRIVTMDNDIPRVLVNNPQVLKATPLAPNQIQLSALAPGVTQVNLWSDKQKVHTIDVVVYADARELENVLATMFPTAQLSVRPLARSVVISGYVPSPDMISAIHRVAEDYYPNVIDNLKVAGVQTVLLHTKVMEVSRTKLRTVGFDWANLNGNDFVIQSVSGVIAAQSTQGGVAGGAGDTMRFGIVDGSNSFFGFVEALRQNNLAKVLAEPTLVTISGRAASFHSGGEFPILIPQALGTISVEYRQFGTRVDFVPFVLGQGRVRLEVRPMVSEVDPGRSVTLNNITVPALRSRWVDTAVEMKAGQTLALAGLLQTRTESENKGLPWLADLPWAGAAFRRVHEVNNEIELLIMVTPEFVDAMDPCDVPCGGPGLNTTSPSDVELYGRGYLEVPKCCPDGTCPACNPNGSPMAPVYGPNMGPPPAYMAPVESIPQGRPPIGSPGNGGAVPNQTGASYSPQAYRQARPPVPFATQRPVQQVSNANRVAPPTRPMMIGPVGYEPVR